MHVLNVLYIPKIVRGVMKKIYTIELEKEIINNSFKHPL